MSIPPENMYRCLWECYFCHFYLWKAGIHHGDISLANIMARKVDGIWYGVLNDYDLAIIKKLTGKRDIGMARTGTQPFMALDLLEDIFEHRINPRIYRYDAESFTWVLTWLSMRYKQGVVDRMNGPPLLEEWIDCTAKVCHGFKNVFFSSAVVYKNLATSDYVPYWPAVCALGYWCYDAYFARNKARRGNPGLPEVSMDAVATGLVKAIQEEAAKAGDEHLHVTTPRLEPFLELAS